MRHGLVYNGHGVDDQMLINYWLDSPAYRTQRPIQAGQSCTELSGIRSMWLYLVFNFDLIFFAYLSFVADSWSLFQIGHVFGILASLSFYWCVILAGERWLQDVHNLENHVNDSREVHRFQMPVLSWSPPWLFQKWWYLTTNLACLRIIIKCSSS